MIRIALYFILVAAIAALAVWVVDEPGEVQIAWGDWQLATSPGALVAAAAILAAIVALLWQVFRWVWTGPSAIAHWRLVRRQRRGYRALTHGLVAAAAGDPKSTRRLARRANLLLGEPPLTLLLSAQAAQLEGDTELAKEYFEAMLDYPATEFLGVRGLLVQANKAGEHAEALALARRAFALRPDTPWVLRTLTDLQIREGDWEQAAATLRSAVRHKVIGHDAGKRREAALLVEQARAARQAGEMRRALKFANEARETDPGFQPALIIAAELALELGRQSVAERIVNEAWERAPHPALGDIFLALHADETPIERVQLVEKLFASNPDHVDSHLLLAQSALDAALWGTARKHLGEALNLRRSAGVYRLMAQLEEAEHGDKDAARRWLIEASNSPPDPAWVCGRCGAPSAEWSIACGTCGAVDTVAWRQPAVLAPPAEEEERRGAEAPPAPGISPDEAEVPVEPEHKAAS